MKFRSDVNGLRALAVLPVVFFHAGVPLFQGGFLGVDVFFVISGYLITKIIKEDAMGQGFSFGVFYEKRVRRIVPPLLFVVLITTIAAFFFMLPYSLKNYGQSVVATLLSLNNVLLYLTSGYWSLAAEFKPLYHTWSLGVEEQFYFIAPAVLLCVFRFLKGYGSRQLFVVSLFFVASYGFSYFCQDREFNFLMLFSRSWELIAGVLLALSEKPEFKGNVVLAAAGLCVLFFSYVAPYKISHNQAIVNFLPVLGSVLVIRFSRPGNAAHRFLSLAPLTFVGLISYSTYLWHQPLVAFARLSSSSPPDYVYLLFVSLFSIPLAYFSWRYVENYFRDRDVVPVRQFWWWTSSVFGLIVMLGVTLHFTYGLQTLWPSLSYGRNPQVYVDEPRSYIRSGFSNDGRRKKIVLGNSFARDYINMLRETGRIENYDLVYIEGDCSSDREWVGWKLLKESSTVVYSLNWGQTGFNEDALEKAIGCVNKMKGVTSGGVYMLGVKNFGWNNDFVKIRSVSERVGVRVDPLDGVLGFESRAKTALGSTYLSILGLVADADGRVPIFTDEGLFVTYDSNHLTKSGARFIGEFFFQRYGELL